MMPQDPANDPSQELPEVPAFLKFSEDIMDDPDPDDAAPKAEMLLLFLAAGGTVLGSLLGAMIYFATTAWRASATPHATTSLWLATALVFVAIGGVCGCAAVMTTLHLKQMVVWENRKRKRSPNPPA